MAGILGSRVAGTILSVPRNRPVAEWIVIILSDTQSMVTDLNALMALQCRCKTTGPGTLLCYGVDLKFVDVHTTRGRLVTNQDCHRICVVIVSNTTRNVNGSFGPQ